MCIRDSSTHIVGPVKTSISLINQIKSVSLIADKIDEILYDSCEDIEEVSLPKFENSIEVKNLDFSYTNDRKALNNINLTFEKNKKDVYKRQLTLFIFQKYCLTFFFYMIYSCIN